MLILIIICMLQLKNQTEKIMMADFFEYILNHVQWPSKNMLHVWPVNIYPFRCVLLEGISCLSTCLSRPYATGVHSFFQHCCFAMFLTANDVLTEILVCFYLFCILYVLVNKFFWTNQNGIYCSKGRWFTPHKVC